MLDIEKATAMLGAYLVNPWEIRWSIEKEPETKMWRVGVTGGDATLSTAHFDLARCVDQTARAAMKHVETLGVTVRPQKRRA